MIVYFIKKRIKHYPEDKENGIPQKRKFRETHGQIVSWNLKTKKEKGIITDPFHPKLNV
jgi:hypothetical protein